MHACSTTASPISSRAALTSSACAGCATRSPASNDCLAPDGRTGLAREFLSLKNMAASGLGCTEMAIVAKGTASALTPEPLTAAAVLAAATIARSDNDRFKRELLEALVAGSLIPALAWQERAGSLDTAAIATRAEPFEAAIKLNGSKNFVAGAAGADGFVVSAQAKDGLALYWLPANTSGVTLDLQPLADGRTTGTLRMNDVVMPKEPHDRLAGVRQRRASGGHRYDTGDGGRRDFMA